MGFFLNLITSWSGACAFLLFFLIKAIVITKKLKLKRSMLCVLTKNLLMQTKIEMDGNINGYDDDEILRICPAWVVI